MIKAVLFDLDGTFADTAPDLAAALNHTRATRNLPPLPLDVIRPQASHGSRGLLKMGFGIEPEHPGYDTLRDIFLDHYERNICVHTRLFAGMAELVAALEQRNVAWGIVTNKPHPEPMLKACEVIGVTPVQCLYLGDDLRDMQAANAAAMRGIIARYGYISDDAQLASWGAHGIIDTPTELLGYLAL